MENINKMVQILEPKMVDMTIDIESKSCTINGHSYTWDFNESSKYLTVKTNGITVARGHLVKGNGIYLERGAWPNSEVRVFVNELVDAGVITPDLPTSRNSGSANIDSTEE